MGRRVVPTFAGPLSQPGPRCRPDGVVPCKAQLAPEPKPPGQRVTVRDQPRAGRSHAAADDSLRAAPFAWDAPRSISPEGARAAARAARPTAGPAERESRRARGAHRRALESEQPPALARPAAAPAAFGIVFPAPTPTPSALPPTSSQLSLDQFSGRRCRQSARCACGGSCAGFGDARREVLPATPNRPAFRDSRLGTGCAAGGIRTANLRQCGCCSARAERGGIVARRRCSRDFFSGARRGPLRQTFGHDCSLAPNVDRQRVVPVGIPHDPRTARTAA